MFVCLQSCRCERHVGNTWHDYFGLYACRHVGFVCFGSCTRGGHVGNTQHDYFGMYAFGHVRTKSM